MKTWPLSYRRVGRAPVYNHRCRPPPPPHRPTPRLARLAEGHDGQHPQGLHRAQPHVHPAGAARRGAHASAPTWSSCRKCWARTRAIRASVDNWPRGAALRVPGRHHVAAVRLRPQRGVSARATTATRCCRSSRSCATSNHDVSVAGPEKRGLLHCVLRLPGRAGRRARDLRAPGPGAKSHRAQQLELLCQIVRDEVPADAPLIVAGDFNDWRGRAHRVLDRRRRPARGVRAGERPRGAHLPGALSAAAAGPHLRAQRRRACAGGAAAQALVAPVGPRAAGRRRSSCERRMSHSRWTAGNRVELLENGEEFFPRVFEAIAPGAARGPASRPSSCSRTRSACELQRVLLAAAQRGVRVDLHGRRLRLARPVGRLHRGADRGRRAACACSIRGQRLLGQRLNVFRRMHRKIVVVDGERAFVGGINFSADHLARLRPEGQAGLRGRARRARSSRRSTASCCARSRSAARRRRWFRRRLRAAERDSDTAPTGERRSDVRHARQPAPHQRHRAPLPRRHPQRARSAS